MHPNATEWSQMLTKASMPVWYPVGFCSQMIPNTPKCSQSTFKYHRMQPNAPKCFHAFMIPYGTLLPSVPKCSQIFTNAPEYFKYNQKTHENIHSLKGKINSSKDLKIFSKEILSLEKEITLFHANVVDEIIQESKSNVEFIWFHGQTIFHNSKERISKQLGDGKILSQLTKKIIVCNFRENDLNNGGEGAPLAPIFHKLIINQHKISFIGRFD